MIFRGEWPAAALAVLLILSACSGEQTDDVPPLAAVESTESAGVARLREVGRARLDEGDLAGTAARFDRALALEPDNARLWIDIAQMRYRGGQQEQSIEAVERALDLAPEDPSALLFRGQIARDAEGLRAGLAWFERGLRFHPDDPALLHDHAAVLIDLDRPAEGLVSLRRLAEVAPGTPDLLYLQAIVAARAGNFGLARSLLQRVPPAILVRPATMLLDAVIAMDEGQYDGAAQKLDALARRQPDNARVERLLVRALFLGGSYRQVIARFGDAAARDGASPYLRELVGMAHEAMGERDMAAAYLDRAAREEGWDLVPLEPRMADRAHLSPQSGDALAARDAIRSRIGSGAAVSKARAFLDASPGAGDGFALLGDSLLWGGDARGAIAAYSRAARIRQNWPLTLRMVAAAMRVAEPERAERIVAQYLRQGGNETEAVELYAVMLAQREEWTRAANLLDTVIDRNSANPRMLSLRSEVALRQGEAAAALGWAWKAYRAQPAYRPSIAAVAKSTGDAALKARLEDKLEAMATPRYSTSSS
ncbi:MAG: tetratricopeptide repeat protein [Erythrobacter sp.]|nr:tetratricopeptide repeat protein [Erythrobacter sp.]